MATTIPQHQAIKFYDESDEYFDNTSECPCGELAEKWQYIIKPGDVTEVQVRRDCIPVEFAANIILNGSFETQGVAPSDAADWTVNDTEKVQRANDDPFQGQWELRWNNPNGLGTATQDTGVNFLAGETWLLEFYTKVTNPATVYLTPLSVTLGGLEYEVTPTEEYEKITIPIVFIANGTDQDIVFTSDLILPGADFMYVDLVTLKKATYTSNNCPFDLVYNGNFEFGQHKVTGDSPVAATFDGWTIGGTVEASLLGGLDGTRCPVLEGDISTAGITQTLPTMIENSLYTIRFWARVGEETTEENYLTVETNDATLSNQYTLTTQWEEYVIENYVAGNDSNLSFYSELDEVYIDNVQISLVNPLNEDSVYVHDIINDKFYFDDIGTTDFENGYNTEFFWEEIFGVDTPGCSQIIFEFADYNLLSNSKFEIGVGNLFTDWILNPDDGTIVQTTNGGVSGSRAVVINNGSGMPYIRQNVLSPNTDYVISFWAKTVTPLNMLILSDTTVSSPITISAGFKRYSIPFSTVGGETAFLLSVSTPSASVTIDNIFISENGEGVHYSDLFKYDKTGGVCAPEIVWYDADDEVFGIDYESGFKNKLRIKDLNFQILSYPTEDFVKALNGLESSISRAVIKKQKTLNITPSPEFIHDRLSVAVRHTNIEIDTVPYCSVEETTYTVVDSETGCRLKPAQVVLGIEGEILAERSINCEE